MARRALNGAGAIGITWTVLLAFLRITTNPRIFPNTLDPETALQVVDLWHDRPNAVLVHPSRSHQRVLFGLLRSTGTAANLVNDGHLAAIAIDHEAAVTTFDADFGRFPGLEVIRPG